MAKQVGTTSTGPRKVVPEFSTRDNGLGFPWVDESEAFILKFHPARWTIMAGRLVPSLGQDRLAPGINMVSKSRDGRVSFAACRAKMEESGWSYIPYEWGPDGESYLQAIDTRPRGARETRTAHMTVWDSAYAGDPRVYPDEEAYSAWLAGLIKDGKIPACPPQIARRMLEKARGKLARAAAQVERGGDGAAEATIRAETLRTQVDVLTKAANTGKRGPKDRGRQASGVDVGS